MKYIQTTDTFLASTLIALNYQLNAVDNNNPQKCAFSFKQTAEIEKDVQKYLTGSLLVNPTTLLQAYKYLLSQLHQHRKEI
jgi:hypothetical protein